MSEEEIKEALSIQISEHKSYTGSRQIDIELLWHDEVISHDSIRIDDK